MTPDAIFWAVLVALLGVEVLALVALRPVVALPMAMAAGLGGSLVSGALASPAGFSVYVADLAAVLMLASATLAWLRQRTPKSGTGIWTALTVLALVSIVRGSLLFGVQRASNFGRGFLFFFLVIWFCARFATEIDVVSVVRRMWMVFAALFSLVAVAFFVRHGLGTYGASGARALDASHALVVSQAGVIALFTFTRHPSAVVRWGPSGAFFVVVLLSNQRTVWAVTLVTLVVAAMVQHRPSSSRARLALVGVCVVAIAFLGVGPESARSSFTAAVSEPTQDTGTFQWRVIGWKQLVERQVHASPVDIAIGNPSGTGYTRRIRHGVAEESPHDFYITALLTMGVAGVWLLMLGYLRVLARLNERARSGSSDAAVLVALLAGQLVFFITYSPNLEQGLLVGATLRVLATAQRSVKVDTVVHG